jgi:hypothetical protein
MPDEVLRARALLAAWRTGHAGQPLPIGLHVIDALATRTEAHAGQTRALLEARLAALLDAQSPAATPAERGGHTHARPQTPAHCPLGGLLQQLAGHDLAKATPLASTGLLAAFPVLPALEQFRRIWARVRTDSQLRQWPAAVPEQAGPLHSSVLVHRAIQLMAQAAPGYLQHFLAYVDALAWMEQLQHQGILATQDAPPATRARKPARRAPRKGRQRPP